MEQYYETEISESAFLAFFMKEDNKKHIPDWNVTFPILCDWGFVDN